MTSSTEREGSPERSNFFRTLSLGDIYGKQKPNPLKIKVGEELYRKLTSSENHLAWAEREKFVRENNMHSIGGFESSRNEGYFVLEGPTRALTYWIPYYSERQLIFQVAHSLVKSSKPVLLEAACGSGLVSKLLAAENHAKVIGIDPYMISSGYHHIPDTPGDVRFILQDLWDGIKEVAPKYSEDVDRERTKFLNAIREEYAKGPIFEYFSMESVGAQMGDPLKLNDEIEKLQELSRLSIQPSPIDLVLCSFMPTTVDLTIPIRDGVHPKCIVYVRPTNGMSGAGDFYLSEAFNDDIEEVTLSPNSAISYNPGKYYRTVARWPTHQQNNWHYFFNPPKFGYVFDAEVVVQLRNDVSLDNVTPTHIEKYNFDKELETAFSKPNELEDFLEGIRKAHAILFCV